MTFYRCADLRLSDVKFINSPKTHVLIQACKRISIANLHISSPKDSPNTDGIHIESSQHVDVRATVIGSGKGGANVAVEDIRVRYASFNGTTNGARIKTRQGVTGYARKISFEHLNFTSVENPIIINQYYCESTTCKNQTMGVKISNVSYIEAFGTSITPVAVSLLCSETAFLKTWDLFCAATGNPTFLIPSGKSFQVGAVELRGPCKSSNPHIQLAGNIVAPNFLWRSATETSSWIAINLVDGLTIDGRGSIDGRGRVWWDCKASKILSVYGSNNFHLGGGLTVTNSPGKHITFNMCNYVTIDGINIVSPGDSPNTDGVYMQETQHVKIQNSFIGTGDDCVAIGKGSVDVNVTNLACGPGHGVSIGSLGAGRFWLREEHFVRADHFNQVYNPIIIDQYYCNGPRGQCANEPSWLGDWCHGHQPCLQPKHGLHGDCHDDINISSGISEKPATSYCLNVHGSIQGSVSPPVSCLH
ncbi:putative polygalacturonase [Acorus calamus]|uniref:Polygalacturonase n=1 Tax=Acorus calamus TaxID=4465 RepID=A0AAV9C2U3_ACOCL|nr:putative polygalacturonase [Acorus calamus]